MQKPTLLQEPEVLDDMQSFVCWVLYVDIHAVLRHWLQ
jgi:hypothetical protein